MLTSITIGWPAIRFAKERFEKAVMKKADELQQDEPSSKTRRPVSEIVSEARTQLLNAPRTWRERFFSLKALHGLFMTIAWYQMFGRLMVTDPVSWGECFTYPAFKDPSGVVRLVPEIDPDYSFQDSETSFALSVTIPSILVFIIVGLVWSVVAERKQAGSDTEMDSARDESESEQ